MTARLGAGSVPPRDADSRVPEKRTIESWLQLHSLCECASIAPLIKNSYVLSRFWAWFSRIEVSPEVRVPVPRFLSRREP
ncbi:MAG: hypothetical protein AB7P49_09690 [Bdellovibrionales bacterium]